MKLYSIFDVGAEESGPPYASKNDTVAYRGFRKLLKDENVDDKFLTDYVLYHIGEFNSETMVITSDIYPVNVLKYEDLANEKEVKSI